MQCCIMFDGEDKEKVFLVIEGFQNSYYWPKNKKGKKVYSLSQQLYKWLEDKSNRIKLRSNCSQRWANQNIRSRYV